MQISISNCLLTHAARIMGLGHQADRLKPGLLILERVDNPSPQPSCRDLFAELRWRDEFSTSAY